MHQIQTAIADLRSALKDAATGDGTTKVYALVPDAVGERLRTLLEAFAQPRIAALEADGRVRPRNRITADALGQLLECVDGHGLPTHGGDSTTVIVTVGFDELRSELGVATMADGTALTAAETRRFACGARILPAVLGGRSEPLDLAQRLFSASQRKALRLRDRHCRAHDPTYETTRLTNGDYRYHRRR